VADEKSLKGTKLSDLVKYKDDGEKGAKGVKFADLVKDINKTYGVGTIAKASTIESLVLKRIPMGVFVLDALTGGGVPVGRTTQFFGEPSGCKTTLCLKTVASAQKTCRFCVQPVDAHTKKDDHKPEPMACVWIEMESTLDRDWAIRMGVDAEKLYVAQPANAEAAGNILQMALQSDDQDVVVIDSLAHMTPGAELENPMENMQVGAMARMLNKMFRTETALMNKRKLTGNGPTVLVINQVREKVGVMYGSPETRPGGKGQAFASSLEIRLAPGKPFYQGANGPIQKAAQDGDRPLFREFNFKVKKAKSAVADVEGSFKLQMSKVEGREIGQTNDEEQVFFFAKKHLLIENPAKGKWLCLGLEDATEEKLQDKIMATEGKFTELRAKTLELVKER
jgi:recombination protein RecA